MILRLHLDGDRALPGCHQVGVDHDGAGAEARSLLCFQLWRRGDYEGALAAAERALATAPNLASAHHMLGATLIHSGRPKQGLAATIRGRSLVEVAGDMLKLSRAGLARRAYLDASGEDETHFLDVLDDRVARRTSPAQELLDKYNGPWGGSVDAASTPGQGCAFEIRLIAKPA